MSVVLVVNSGSSSIKYQILDMATYTVLGKGLVERIGESLGRCIHTNPDGQESTIERFMSSHTEAFVAMIEACSAHGPDLHEVGLQAIGHRVVQGADYFDKAAIITDEVIGIIEEIAPLAPLHNPASLLGIQGAIVSFPELPQVAVFDTAFHQTMGPAAYTYAMPPALTRQYKIRRYGAHGTSHKYVSRKVAEYLQLPYDGTNSIVLHIGNGASACAVREGKSVETSMGMTPLEGLVMGTRCGDIDPAVLFHLSREAGMTTDELDNLCNRESGMLGLGGSNDLRDIWTMADAGDEAARIAIDVYCHRIKGYVGSYLAHLGHVNAIAWTAGVGENDAGVRAKSLENLERLGIRIDPERNAQRGDGIRRISTDDSDIMVLVVPTNEELAIAEETVQALQA